MHVHVYMNFLLITDYSTSSVYIIGTMCILALYALIMIIILPVITVSATIPAQTMHCSKTMQNSICIYKLKLCTTCVYLLLAIQGKKQQTQQSLSNIKHSLLSSELSPPVSWLLSTSYLPRLNEMALSLRCCTTCNNIIMIGTIGFM